MKIFKLSLLALILAAVGCKPQYSASSEAKKELNALESTVNKTQIIKKDSAFTVLAIDRTRKTVYRGLKNPLTIVVPGAVTTKVEGNGLMKVDNFGHYDLRPGTGPKTDIKITAAMPDGSTFVETRSLNIKNLPNPKSYLARVMSSSATALVLTEAQIQQAEISLMMVDFDYDMEIIVTGFDVLFPSGKKIKVEGNRLDAAALDLLKKVRHNAQIKIQNISAYTPDASYWLFRPEPITVKINKKAHPKN